MGDFIILFGVITRLPLGTQTTGQSQMELEELGDCLVGCAWRLINIEQTVEK